MTSFNDLQQIIDRGEDTQTEFKAALSEEVLKGLPTDLAAIANSQGGRIIFGVTDDKDPVGIVLTGEEFNRISQCASNCRPVILAEPEEIRFGT
jgi:predicted HTH transcriptional regulator